MLLLLFCLLGLGLLFLRCFVLVVVCLSCSVCCVVIRSCSGVSVMFGVSLFVRCVFSCCSVSISYMLFWWLCFVLHV